MRSKNTNRSSFDRSTGNNKNPKKDVNQKKDFKSKTKLESDKKNKTFSKGDSRKSVFSSKNQKDISSEVKKRPSRFEKFGKDSNQDLEKENKEFIYGRHAVAEGLTGDLEINKIWVDENFKDTRDLFKTIKELNIPYQLVNKQKLNNLVGEVNHQGIIASISGKEYTDFYDLIESSKGQDNFFLILDKVEDPHNLGAIIRTADAVGVTAIIIPKHGAVGVTGIVAKTSAGALTRMKISRVTNISQAIEKLKEAGVWIIGVDMDGKDIYTKANLKGNIALLLGGEGKGVSKGLRNNCDFMVKIPMKSHANSLNVSVATAVVCYEVFRQRDFN